MVDVTRILPLVRPHNEKVTYDILSSVRGLNSMSKRSILEYLVGAENVEYIYLALRGRYYEGLERHVDLVSRLAARLLDEKYFSRVEEVLKHDTSAEIREKALARIIANDAWAYRALGRTKELALNEKEFHLLLAGALDSKARLSDRAKTILTLNKKGELQLNLEQRLRVFGYLNEAYWPMLKPERYLPEGGKYTDEERTLFIGILANNWHQAHDFVAWEGKKGEYYIDRPKQYPVLALEERKLLLEPAYRYAIRTTSGYVKDLLDSPSAHLFSEEQKKRLEELPARTKTLAAQVHRKQA